MFCKDDVKVVILTDMSHHARRGVSGGLLLVGVAIAGKLLFRASVFPLALGQQCSHALNDGYFFFPGQRYERSSALCFGGQYSGNVRLGLFHEPFLLPILI